MSRQEKILQLLVLYLLYNDNYTPENYLIYTDTLVHSEDADINYSYKNRKY
mgnify:CR=1 FL=1